MSNTDKRLKLVTRLGQIEEKITNLQAEYNDVATELASTFQSTEAPTNKGAKTIKTVAVKDGELGNKIVAFLQSNGGKDLAQLSAALGVEPKKIGLSLYHQQKKGRVFSDKGQYYAAATIMAAAAKTTTEGDN